jgi:hypothetical protein
LLGKEEIQSLKQTANTYLFNLVDFNKK